MKAVSWRAHEVINALVEVAEGALSDVRVFNGPPRRTPSGKTLLLVGWDAASPYHAASRRGESDITGRNVETGEIACYLATASGDGDLSAARGRAADILADLEAAIRANHTLNGSCDHAEIGDSVGLQQFQTGDDGASVGVAFSVAYEAYI